LCFDSQTIKKLTPLNTPNYCPGFPQKIRDISFRTP
jgi:hypothetical protein